MSIYVGIIVATLLLVVLCETGLLETGQMAHDKQSEFFITALMELFTLGGAFLGLRLFKFKVVHDDFLATGAPALLKWGMLRLVLLELPMFGNTIFYYMYMNPTFGYLAIILLLCLPFVCPTMSRCEGEVAES